LKRITLLANILIIAGLALSACAPSTPQVVEKEVVVEKPVVETVVVEKEKVVEKPVVETVIIEKEKVVEKVVTPTPPSKKGGTFVTSIEGDPASLNGILANDGASLSVICLNQLPLTLGGENWGNVIAGELAESWEVSEDGREWVFHLRKGVKWHDGQPFTADDVLFTFQALQNPDVQAVSGFRERFMQEGEPIPFEKVDDYTVKASLKKPIASFATDITVPIIPKHVLEGQDINTAPFNQKPIGVGPFKVVEWRSGEMVVLEANPDFYRGEPYLDRWVMRIVPSMEANVIALQAGEIDFGQIPGKDAPKFFGSRDFTIYSRPWEICDVLLFNNAKPFFQDKRVKQALMHGLDRQALLDTALQGYGTVADSPFNPPVFVYQEGDLPPYEFDLDRARELLKEAGWEDTDGDGIVDKDGVPFKVELGVFTVAAPHQRIAPLVQAWWKDIGVEVTIKNVEVAAFFEAAYKPDIEKPFDIQFTAWGLYGPEPDHYAGFYAPEKQELSFINFYNEEIKALFDRGRQTFDLEERKKIYEEAERKLWEELPVLPLFYREVVYVVNNRVNIDEAELDPSRLPPFRYPEKIYIQEK
jgi:peptide/nickel transport system substrate-binding protein